MTRSFTGAFTMVLWLFGLVHAAAQTKRVLSLPLREPATQQDIEGGFWRIDQNFDSLLHLKNLLLHRALDITPSLVMADGSEYRLQDVHLAPAAVATIDIRRSVISVRAHAGDHTSDYGTIIIRYKWSWRALVASIQSVDEIQSLTFRSDVRASVTLAHSPDRSPQTVLGTWWLPTTQADGYLALVNTQLRMAAVHVRLLDATGAQLTDRFLDLASHGTALLTLSSLLQRNVVSLNETGGVEISYSGPRDSILAYGGVEDINRGFSANIPLLELHNEDLPAQTPHAVALDSAGLMQGKADPKMLFPQGTTFSPYLLMRNLTSRTISLRINYSVAAAKASSPVNTTALTLPPSASRWINAKTFLPGSTLPDDAEYANLRVSYEGLETDIQVSAGSVDESGNYVFEVPTTAEHQTAARIICYWSTQGDTNSMISVWNYAPTPQNLSLFFYFDGGRYVLPLTLDSGASYAFDVASLIRNQTPDSYGNVIPINVNEGSALLTKNEDDTAQFTAAVSASVFNVRNGTCGVVCTTCNGVTALTLLDTTPPIYLQDQRQLTSQETYNTGTVSYVSNAGAWSSQYPSVVGIVAGTGMASGAGAGASSVQFLIDDVPVDAGNICNQTLPICPNANMGANAPVQVKVPDHLSVLSDTGPVNVVCSIGSSLVRQIHYNVIATDSTSWGRQLALSETLLPGTATDTCTDGGVNTSFVCTPSQDADGPGTFYDTLDPRCPTSAAAAKGCGFSFQDQTWRWCSPLNPASPIPLGDLGALSVMNTKITVGTNSTDFPVGTVPPK